MDRQKKGVLGICRRKVGKQIIGYTEYSEFFVERSFEIVLDNKVQDIAGKDYWDCQWSNFCMPEIINPKSKKPGDIIRITQDKIFKKFLNENQFINGGKNKKLLEIGCANSALLPYMKKEFGFDVYGLDYSKAGCVGAKRVLEYYGASGTVMEGDMFDPPKELLGKFDIVISGGN